MAERAGARRAQDGARASALAPARGIGPWVGCGDRRARAARVARATRGPLALPRWLSNTRRAPYGRRGCRADLSVGKDRGRAPCLVLGARDGRCHLLIRARRARARDPSAWEAPSARGAATTRAPAAVSLGS